MMKKKVFLIVVLIVTVCIASGCSVFSMFGGQGQKQSEDVGLELEEFGFQFVIPEGATSHGIDDGTYNIDFGKDGEQGFISISPAESAPGMDAENVTIHNMTDVYKASFASNSYITDVSGEISEVVDLGGHDAFYYGFECNILGIPTHMENYILIEDGAIYSMLIQTYPDDITEESLASIESFVSGMKFVG